MRFLSSPPSSWWLEKYPRRCFNNGASNVPTYRVLGVRWRKKLFCSWLERSQSRGLRGNFKLISTWDLCLPRKQRTFLFRIFLLLFFFLSSLCFSTSPMLFFCLQLLHRRFYLFFAPLRFKETSYIFYIRCTAPLRVGHVAPTFRD